VHPTLKEILLDVERIEPFPQIAIRVLEISMQETTGPNDLVEVIKTDAGSPRRCSPWPTRRSRDCA